MTCNGVESNSCDESIIKCPISSVETECIIDCRICSDLDIFAIYGLYQLNTSNIDSDIDTNNNVHCDYNFDKSCVIGIDCDFICHGEESMLSIGILSEIVIPFDNSLLSCKNTGNCIIYMESTNNAKCTKSDNCTILCLDDTCSGTIDGGSCNILTLDFKTSLNLAGVSNTFTIFALFYNQPVVFFTYKQNLRCLWTKKWYIHFIWRYC